MGKYVVCAGQNVYDVALHLYGSVEGVTDLLICNRGLSFSTVLRQGDELEYTDGYVIREDVVLYNRIHGVVPANGERSVYAKFPTLPLLLRVSVRAELTSVRMELSGSGVLEVDWGDNAALERIVLEDEPRGYGHSFDSPACGKRVIRVYGGPELRFLDLSGLGVTEVFLLSPLEVESLRLAESEAGLGFLMLAQGLYELVLNRVRSYSLLPLLACKGLMRLDLRESVFRSSVLDEYLIGLVEQYYGRRSCEVLLPSSPSGEYREPQRDEYGNYILTSGMEAVWVLTHEPAWNEGRHWRICINERVFEYEQND